MKESVYEQKKLFNCYCSLILPKLNSERKAESKHFFYLMKTFSLGRIERPDFLKIAKLEESPLKPLPWSFKLTIWGRKDALSGILNLIRKPVDFHYLILIIGNDKIQAESGLRVHWKYLLLLKSIFIIHSAW